MESSGIKKRVFCLQKRVRGPTQSVIPRGVSTFSSSHRAVSALRVILQIQFVRYFADNFCQCKNAVCRRTKNYTPIAPSWSACGITGYVRFLSSEKPKIMCVPPKIWYYSVLILFGIIFYVNFATISVTNVVKITFSDIF